MKRSRRCLVLMVALLTLQSILPAFAVNEGPAPRAVDTTGAGAAPTVTAVPTPSPRATPKPTPATANALGVEVGPNGGTVSLPGGAEMIIPDGAVAVPVRFSWSSVEMRLAGDLPRFHTLDQAVRINAWRSDNGMTVASLQRPANVKLKLSRPLRD